MVGSSRTDLKSHNLKILSRDRYDAILAETKEDKSDPEAFWKRLKQLYPGFIGIVGFSAIGFNADKTVAVLYMSWSCGSLCGNGTIYLLRKKKGSWRVAEAGQIPCWIS